MSTQVQTPSTYLSSPASTPADEALLCRGCRLRFDATHRRPLVLQCLHSFCEMCIRGFAGPKHGKKVTCKVCRATTKLDRNPTGSFLPINYAILETLSGSSRVRPVTVIAKSEGGPVPRCSGQTGQYTGERVTVIPIHKNEADTDQSQRASANDGDDHRQSTGTTSINVGQRRIPKDSHVTTATTMTSLPTSSEAKGSRLSMIVTMASSASGPRDPSCAAAQPTPVNGSCSQTMAPCMAPSLAPTVTSLMVKSSASTSHPSHATGGTSSEANQPPAPVDLCCQCHIHPATLTVASATQMSSQKLCSSCYALIEQHKLDVESESPARNHVPPRRIPQNASGSCDVPSTTVIKVLDEQNTGSSWSCAASQSSIAKSSAPLSLPPVLSEEGHRGSIHVDGKRIGPPVQEAPTVRGSALNTETTIALDDRRPKESDLKPAVKPTYVACSKFDLRTEGTDKKRRDIDSSSTEDYPECAHVNDTDVVSEEIYRPLPYNPDFVASGPDPRLQPRAPLSDESLHPVLRTEKQPLEFQAAALPGGPVYPYPVQGPPRYEEIVSLQGVLSADPPVHSASVRCVNAFGKYGELATQPGAFRSPTRINASRGGVVVVTDSAHRTVQAFNVAGECLALIRVSGDTANGCSCYEKNKLAVATNCGVEVYNFNGTLKKTIPLGPVINTVAASNGQGFIVVQPKALSIFRGPTETLVRTLRDRSKPGPMRQPVPFDNLADAAVNSQQDIVVLDAGAASGLGMIFIVSDDGYLKSCIVPGREPCGVLRQPTAIAVDQAHNIIVSDSANRRVLLFAANGKFHRQLIGPGHSADLKTWPVGLDISDDGRLFVVVKGDKFAEIRVFTYH